MLKRLNCPITQAPAEVIFSRSYRLNEFQPLLELANLKGVEDLSYEIRYCPSSDFYFQTWVMEEHELHSCYDTKKETDDFLKEVSKQKLHWFAHQAEEILVFRQVCKTPLPTVLDFGCHFGKWASMALAFGCDVYGLEVNPGASRFCSQRGIKMVSLDQLSELRFDFINCDQVMEHLTDPLEMAQKLSGCLKSGGLFKISTPKSESLPKQLKLAQQSRDNSVINFKTLDALAPFIHVNLFTKTAFHTLAEKCGLRPFALPFWKWFGAGQLWNVPRQFNRNLRTPFKRWRGKENYVWLQKPL